MKIKKIEGGAGSLRRGRGKGGPRLFSGVSFGLGEGTSQIIPYF